MEIPLLYDVVIIFALSVVVIFLFHKLKLPIIIGFLITGIIAGPSGLALISSIHEVELLAEVGILLLLFTIGIEFSFKEMLQLRKPVLQGGTLQVGISILLVVVVAFQFAGSLGQSIFWGFLIALSSTAIVLRIYNDSNQINSPHGRTSLAMLIYQDIIVVPMMLVVPILAGQSANISQDVLLLVGKALLVIGLVFVLTKYVVPFLLHQVAATKSRELFLLTILVICFGIVWLTAILGLSLALGAFLAGLIISESEYSHQALGNILPFRDVFTSLFFVSIGMLLNLEFLFSNFWIVLPASIGIYIVKVIIVTGAAASLKLPFRYSLLTGLGLGQVGEFSFILARTGIENGFLSGDNYQMFLAVSILTMAGTPLIISQSPKLVDKFFSIDRFKNLGRGIRADEVHDEKISDHVLIIGFGLNGSNIAHAASEAKIPYCIVEANPDTVKREQANGEPIIFGDASNEEVLKYAGIEKARVVVVAINDPTLTRRITNQIKELAENVYLIVRTRFVREMEDLYKLGADEVIPEEFETSVEIFTRVLTKYLVPRDEIEKFVSDIRSHSYEMLRNFSDSNYKSTNLKLHFPDLEIVSFTVHDLCEIENQSLKESDFRNQLGASVIAIERDGEVNTSPQADHILKSGDVIFMLAKHDNIPQLKSVFYDKSENRDQDESS